MELNIIPFTIQELFEIAKSCEELNASNFEIDRLGFENQTDFFKDFENFMNQQYKAYNTLEIQKETIAFIFNCPYEIETEVDNDSYDDIYKLKIGDKEFNLNDYPASWTFYIRQKEIQRDDFSAHNRKELFINIENKRIKRVLESDLYEYIKRFNEKNKMDKKYPRKETLMKRIINKI